MNVELLKARQTRYAAYATVYILVVFVIVVIANILADKHNKSFDATANKRYSLSPQTAKIVKELKQDADITYFDKPRGLEGGKDLLQQYTDLSPRIHVKYVDIDKEPMLARAAGVTRPGEAIVQIGDRKEEAKSFSEEGVSGAIIRDLKNTARNICFVQGSGEHPLDDNAEGGFSRLSKSLGRDEYTAKSISLLEKAEVPADCTVLVVGGPTKDYLQPEVDTIKKYVEGGGRALFLLDPPLKMGKGDIADNDALADLLQGWGITLDKDMVLDLNPLSQIVGGSVGFALVNTYKSHPIVNEMKATDTGFPFARSLEVKNTDKTNVEQLFDSSPSSLATTTLDSPRVDIKDPKNKRGPLLLAAAGTYNTGKENSQGRFVVVGNSNWAANAAINFNGNADLALNTMNWLASDEDLISIRPKEQDDRHITMTRAQFNLVLVTSQFLLPLGVILAGVGVWLKRR